jgi:hypothetical protein
MATTRRPTKAELKRARVEAARAAVAREERRARNKRIALWVGPIAAAVVLVVALVVMLNRPARPASPTAVPSAAISAGGTANPSWGAPANASAAVAAAGLPMLGAEGTALHIHAHLDVFVNGSPVPVAALVGIDEAAQKISPLHTHDTTGVIHIESPDAKATFTLGQFFTEWQVPLSASQLGGLNADSTHQLKEYVNGKVRDGDPASLQLAAHDEIALVYGSPPASVPSSYQWTNGL